MSLRGRCQRPICTRKTLCYGQRASSYKSVGVSPLYESKVSYSQSVCRVASCKRCCQAHVCNRLPRGNSSRDRTRVKAHQEHLYQPPETYFGPQYRAQTRCSNARTKFESDTLDGARPVRWHREHVYEL